MAKMMPSFILDDHGSGAERKVFDWFKNTPEDWFVFHSYIVAKDKYRRGTELDFLVLAPNLGVFGLEVKGGRIGRRDGQWFSVDRAGKLHYLKKDPFAQVQEATYQIHYVIEKKLGVSFCFGYGVVFPDIDFKTEDLTGIEANPKQILDRKGGNNAKSFIKNLSKLYCPPYSTSKFKIPDDNDVREIVKLLRPDFDIPYSHLVLIDDITKKQIKFTNEQFERLDDLELNDRCLLFGEAGTGKTFLAIEHALRLAKQGKKTGLFCYNDNIGDWLKIRFKDENDFVYAGGLHRFMYGRMKKSGIKIILDDGTDFIDIMTQYTGSGVPDNIWDKLRGKDDFWEHEIPAMMLEALKKIPVKFDKIIVDEALDLLQDGYLLVLDAMLEGGIEDGKWCIAGDILQSISPNPRSYEGLINLLDGYTKNYTKIRLKTNCRNTKEIAAAIENITNLKFSIIKDDTGGLPVEYEVFDTKENQARLIERKLKELHDNGIHNNDIVILTPYRKKSDSAVSLIQNKSIRDYSPEEDGKIRFCDIKRFKGLESKVLILADIYTYTDIEVIMFGKQRLPGEENLTPKLLYTAMSRARAQLIIFESKAAGRERQKLINQTRLQEDKK
jgi:hypothetical protein